MRTPRLRLLSAILAVALFFTLLPVSALAEGGGSTGVSHVATRSLNTDNKDDQGLTYTLNADHTATVANYDNNTPDGVIDIPDTVKKDNIDYTVTAIGNNAFCHSYTSTNVSSVFIPATVTSIGNGAFSYCRFLATVTFAEGSQLKSIGASAFFGSEYEHPIFTEIKIPDSVETIGSRAFYWCRNLKKITLPSALKTLSLSTFTYCTSLSDVYLPASLTDIGSNIFFQCSSLTNIYYAGSLAQWSQINVDKDFLSVCSANLITTDYTVYFNDESPDFFNLIKKVTITQYKGTENTTAIPETIGGWPVTKIEENAFNNNTNLETVNFSGSKTQWDNITGKDALSNIRLVCGKLEATFTADGTTFAPAQTIDRGGKFTEPAAPSKENHTFAGWYNGDEPFDFDADTTNAPNVLNLVAKWDINKYTVQFVSDHGSFADQTIEHGKLIETDKLTIPKVEGYTFDGWYTTDDTDSTEFDFTQPIKSNTTVYAKWTANDYYVSFVTEHGAPPTSQNVKYNGTADDPGTLTEEGYTFDGWYTDDNYSKKFDFTQPIKSNTTVYAKWTANDYYVSFVTEHGAPPTSQNVKYNGTADDPGTLTEEGYTFDGWYTDDNYSKKFDFTQPIKSNTTVYAKWTANDYEVSFITEHGNPPTSQNVTYNGTATNPGELTAEGYTFIGWYTDENRTIEFDFTKPITGDTKVYAKWEKNAPNTYALNVSGAFVYVDGVDVTASAGDTSLKLEKDASVRLVADPDRMPSGMVFDRWTILNGALNADDAEKFETGRTLEEFAFTMPAEPLSIEATPRMQEEEGSDTASVILGVTLGTAATALVAWQAYDLGMSLYQEHWLPADFVMPKTRAELALLLWNTAGRPAPAAQPAFTDIPDPDTAQAAQWAVETGLMTPKSADLFKPEKSVTRWKAIRSWKRVTNQNT